MGKELNIIQERLHSNEYNKYLSTMVVNKQRNINKGSISEKQHIPKRSKTLPTKRQATKEWRVPNEIHGLPTKNTQGRRVEPFTLDMKST
jgi:hypothetical protein